jgi:protein-tyrosine phosphatase
VTDKDAARILALEGAHNFRDLGGYRTAQGRTVRRGRVFRSGSITDLTAAEEEYLARLGIRVVCDFRSTGERRGRSISWPSSAPVEFWWRDYRTSFGNLVEMLSHPTASPEDTRNLMIANYRELPYEQADSYRELFSRIARNELPILFHCAVGKDRTGIAAALLLTALDVPRQTVLEDYLVTERFFEQARRMVLSDPTTRHFTVVDEGIWEPLLRADQAYLEAMFETVEQRHGSTAAYLREVLQVDDDAAAALRTHLVE